MSDSGLLAIILQTGSKGESAMDLAREILQNFKTFRAIGQERVSLKNGACPIFNGSPHPG